MGHGYVHLMTWIVLVRSSSGNPQSMHEIREITQWQSKRPRLTTLGARSKLCPQDSPWVPRYYVKI